MTTTTETTANKLGQSASSLGSLQAVPRTLLPQSSSDTTAASGTASNDTTSDDLYAARIVPGKGIGLFANRNIPKGTILIQEPAVLEALLSNHLDSTRINLVWDFNKLDVGTKEAIGRMCAWRPLNNESGFRTAYRAHLQNQYTRAARRNPFINLVDEDKKIDAAVHLVRTYETNSFQWFPPGYKHASNMFLETSKINHSCAPNAGAEPGEKDSMKVLTIRDVVKGEEITIEYNYGKLPLEKRRAELKSGWGFDCQCERCATEHANEAEQADRLVKGVENLRTR